MDGNKYVLNKINQLSNTNLKGLFNSPSLIVDGGFMICTNGDCEIILNDKTYKVTKWGLIVVSPYSIIQVKDISKSFDCAIIGASLDFFSHINLPNKGFYFIKISSHPSLALTAHEANEILYYKEILLKEEQKDGEIYFNEIYNSILKIITLKIFAFYSNREPNKELILSRNNEIFNTFIYDLLRHNHKERKLEFYAQKQSITPSHLSRCVKSVAGKNASSLLIDSIINSIKYSLHDTTKSISDISNEFNFSNNSTFSQFFKKYTNMSPRDFKKTIIVVRGMRD